MLTLQTIPAEPGWRVIREHNGVLYVEEAVIGWTVVCRMDDEDDDPRRYTYPVTSPAGTESRAYGYLRPDGTVESLCDGCLPSLADAERLAADGVAHIAEMLSPATPT